MGLAAKEMRRAVSEGRGGPSYIGAAECEPVFLGKKCGVRGARWRGGAVQRLDAHHEAAETWAEAVSGS